MGRLRNFFYKQKIIDLLELFGILFSLVGVYLILYPGSWANAGVLAGKIILIIGIVVNIAMCIYFIKDKGNKDKNGKLRKKRKREMDSTL